MTSLTFDIETNGLLDHLTEVKCLNIKNNATGEEERYTDYEFYLDAYTGEKTNVRTPRTGTIREGISRLDEAEEICGHHIEGFDIPAIKKVYGWEPKARRFDTAAISRLMYTDIVDRDVTAGRKGKIDMPKKLKGTHKLAAWGIRLGGAQKADFDPKTFGWTWDDYPLSKECDDYCMDDVRVNVELVEHFKQRLEETGVPRESYELEQDVVRILQRQMDHGWLYDIEAAEALVVELQKEKLDLEATLQDTFQDYYKRDGARLDIPKKSMRRWVENENGGITRTVKGEEQTGWYEFRAAGCGFQKIKLVSFNPASRHDIANRLTYLFDWVPEEFTPKGSPKVDETTLSKLTYPEAKLIVRYLTVGKMLGQVADGQGAQLKKVNRKTGRMHGYVNHNGAVTGRMTHSGPNVAQTDKDPRVRSLYIVPPGKKLVGCDADGIEGCCLSHYLARYDGGKYIEVILSGDKALGTDLHSRNRDAVGMNSRDNAKTIFYAWMYGAGDYTLGVNMYEDWDAEKKSRFNARYQGEPRKKRLILIGQKARAKLVAGIDGMERLIKLVKDKSKSPGYVRGLDGRRVLTRAQHSALNTLLQSAGALIMKKALVLLDNQLQADGLVPGVDYEFVGNIHDELQIEAEERHAVHIGEAAAAAIVAAGEYFEFRIPLSGSYDIGDNWSETH